MVGFPNTVTYTYSVSNQLSTDTYYRPVKMQQLILIIVRFVCLLPIFLPDSNFSNPTCVAPLGLSTLLVLFILVCLGMLCKHYIDIIVSLTDINIINFLPFIILTIVLIPCKKEKFLPKGSISNSAPAVSIYEPPTQVNKTQAMD